MKTLILFGLFAFGYCQFHRTISSSEFGKTYFLSNQGIDFYEAKKLCESTGAKLVQPRSQAEVDYLDRIVIYERLDVWIGAEPGVYEIPTKFLGGEKIKWTNWLPSLTDNPQHHPIKDCTALTLVRSIGILSSRPLRKWSHAYCFTRNKVVCEKSN